MRFLLDEDVSPTVADAMQAMAEPGDVYVHVLALAGRNGLLDDEVVELCHKEQGDTLITLNVKDFGARKHYYASLNQRAISVVVARPAKQQPDTYQQVALICAQFETVRAMLATATGPILIKLTRSSAVRRTLEELLAEVQGLP